MTTKIENATALAPEMESWPVISFSRRKRTAFVGERELFFKHNDSYHIRHWDVLIALLEGKVAPPGEPALSTELKSYSDQNRSQGSTILSISASVNFLNGRIKEDPSKREIIIRGGKGVKSTVTLKARVVELGAPGEQEEKKEEEAIALIPYKIPPEINLSFLDNGSKKEANQHLIKTLKGIRNGVDISITFMLLSWFKNNIEGEGASLTEKASEMLKAVCPDVDEKYYGTVVNKQKFLEIITGYEEGRPEVGVYIVHAFSETSRNYWDLEQNPGLLFDSQRVNSIIRLISFFKGNGIARGQLIAYLANHFGIETPEEYSSEKPNPRVRLHEKGSDGRLRKMRELHPTRKVIRQGKRQE